MSCARNAVTEHCPSVGFSGVQSARILGAQVSAHQTPISFSYRSLGVRTPGNSSLTAGADAPLMAAVSAAYGPLEQKNHFLLHRGPYTVGAVMDESVSEAPLKVDGTLIDLYDPELPVLREKTIGPGEQFFLYDVRKAPKAPAVLAASSRESDVKAGKDSYSYIAKGPADTYNISRILLPSAPVQVLVGGADAPYTWNEGSRTLLVRFPNSPDGVTVQIRWK